MKKPVRKESAVQRSVIQYLRLKKYHFDRINSGATLIKEPGKKPRYVKFSTPGMADIIACVNGMFYAIEIKSSVGKQNENQKRFQEKVESSGGKYLIIREIEDLQKAGL